MDYDFPDEDEFESPNQGQDYDDDFDRQGLDINFEASYICPSCGEEIVVPLDISQGATQEYVEDCPVCCHPNLIEVRLGPDGTATVTGRSE